MALRRGADGGPINAGAAGEPVEVGLPVEQHLAFEPALSGRRVSEEAGADQVVQVGVPDSEDLRRGVGHV